VIRARRRRPDRAWHDPAVAREFIAYTRTLYSRGKITRHEYIFHAVWPAERVYARRVEDGHYGDLLRIRETMGQLLEGHGLERGQQWLKGHGPADYERLSVVHDAEHAYCFQETLREFGLHDIAELVETDPADFERLRERGRRLALQGRDFAGNLRDTVIHYEREARRAASAGAYTAAVTSLSVALKGLLLLCCVHKPSMASRIAAGLPPPYRPRNPKRPTLWRFLTLLETALKAGWLRGVPNCRPADVAVRIRMLHDYLHAGRQAENRPWSETVGDEYEEAQALYLPLFELCDRWERSTGESKSEVG